MGQHYHLIGIGGIGMAGLASLLLSQGVKVSGSDVKESALIQTLREKGAVIAIGHDVGHIEQPDYVVFSSAIKADNPELLAARTQHIPVLKRAQLLAQMMDGHTGITVAGAHGKTTTSSMVAHLLIRSGLKPTVAVGGMIRDLDANALLGESGYFVAELDESDGSFLLFHPKVSVVTNIDYEHIDYYGSWEHILQSYKKFLNQTQPEGTLIVCGEDERLQELLPAVDRDRLIYGFQPRHDLYAQNIQFDTEGLAQTRFTCVTDQGALGEVVLPTLGRHNVLNALACVGVGIKIGLDFSAISSSLASYPGVNRRLQLKGRAKEVCIYDDYGHHPTEIKAVLSAARFLKNKRLITVFQPHRYSRTQFLFHDFVQALKQSDILIVTDIYGASEVPIEGVNSEALVASMKQAGNQNVCFLPQNEIVDYLLDFVRAGDVVLTLGAGDIYKAGERLLTALRET